jgi:hypothetical protein
MRDFFDEKLSTFHLQIRCEIPLILAGAAQGFSAEAYFKYVEGGNPRRTPLIGKIAIYGWKLNKNYHTIHY